MPRFFCDYCDAYLTHDSAPGRQQHIRGWRHRENFRVYYMNFFPHFIAKQQALQALQNMPVILPPPMYAQNVTPGAPPPMSFPHMPGQPGMVAPPPQGFPQFRPPPGALPPPGNFPPPPGSMPPGYPPHGAFPYPPPGQAFAPPPQHAPENSISTSDGGA